MHAFYASGRRYNHSQRAFFRLPQHFQPVFWTSACCSFNWVTVDTKAHKSNFITLSFGTSTQRGNIYRQLSEKWSFAIWHKQSNPLCHGSKAAPVCRAHRIWAGIQETSRKSRLSVVLLKRQPWNQCISIKYLSCVFQGNMDICIKTFIKTEQHCICQSNQRKSLSPGCSSACFVNGACSHMFRRHKWNLNISCSA